MQDGWTGPMDQIHEVTVQRGCGEIQQLPVLLAKRTVSTYVVRSSRVILDRITLRGLRYQTGQHAILLHRQLQATC